MTQGHRTTQRFGAGRDADGASPRLTKTPWGQAAPRPDVGTRTTRAERAQQALILREQGMTYKQIAATLGISYSYTHGLITDPLGDKERDRKTAYGRPCLVCGRLTDGSNGRNKAPLLCTTCYREANAPQHGSYGRYCAGCRCAKCRQANRRQHRKLRDRTPPNHGVSGYFNYRCRCQICREAGSYHNKLMREARIERELHSKDA